MGKRKGSSLQSKVKRLTGGGSGNTLMSDKNLKKYCRSMKLGPRRY